ncbi:MAG: type VI secretion system ATPase TssH, partial [Planctomycetota bacterium]
MQSLNLKALIGRLDDLCRASLEEAADLCVSRTHYSVEIEHFVSRLLNRTDTDLHRLLLTFDVSPATLEAELTRAIDCMKTGNSRPPVLSKQLIDVLRSATLVAELEFAAARVRSGHILL